MKRHTNYCLSISEKTIDSEIDLEIHRGQKKYGDFNSGHELYAVLKEEIEEFWESVKNKDPDPVELIQICAVAKKGILQLCEGSRNELKK